MPTTTTTVLQGTVTSCSTYLLSSHRRFLGLDIIYCKTKRYSDATSNPRQTNIKPTGSDCSAFRITVMGSGSCAPPTPCSPALELVTPHLFVLSLLSNKLLSSFGTFCLSPSLSSVLDIEPWHERRVFLVIVHAIWIIGQFARCARK